MKREEDDLAWSLKDQTVNKPIRFCGFQSWCFLKVLYEVGIIFKEKTTPHYILLLFTFNERTPLKISTEGFVCICPGASFNDF